MTREPVPLDETQIESETAPPPIATGIREPLREPTPKFMTDLAAFVRGGASPSTVAGLLGVSRSTYKAWLKRKGEPYDTLRATLRSALDHAGVRAELEAFKKHPERALRRLRVREEQAEAGRSYSSAPRPYTQAGQTLIAKAMPYLVERVNDSAIPASDLTPVEQGARAWRDEVLRDLGDLTAARRALLDAALGSWIVLSSVDAYLMQMAASDGLVSRKHRRLFPVVEQRARLADSLVRQMLALGLDRAKPDANVLSTYIADKYGDNAEHEQEIDPKEPPA